MANSALVVWALLSTLALADGLVLALARCARPPGVRSPAAGFAAAPTEVRSRPTKKQRTTGALAVTCGVTDGPGARQGSA